jgi:hypothetical protein
LIRKVKPKPDISLAKKTGHFDLLTTGRKLKGPISFASAS